LTAHTSGLFRVENFRCLGTSVFLNSVGMMGEVVALGWLSLELTRSPLLVGLAMSMRALPLFFVGVPAGALADRVPRHRLLMATGAGQALTAATLGTLTLVGVVGFAHVLALTLAAGICRGVEHAARQSYTHDVVGAAGLVRGFAVLGVAMRAGWLLGSLSVGAIIARSDAGVGYLFVACGYFAGALALLLVSPPEPVRPSSSDAGSLWRSVMEFLAAVRSDRTLLVLMALTASAEVLGFAHQVVLPSLARDVLHTGPEGLGVLNGARSVGGILGLAAAALTRGAARSSGAFFLLVIGCFGASLIALGAAPYLVGLAGVVAVLTIANAAGALADLLAQSLLQLRVPPHLRGRAGGAWVLAIGLAPIGQLQIGALASLFGVSAALAATGFALAALAVGAAFLFPRVRRL
jgi:MFS family permease